MKDTASHGEARGRAPPHKTTMEDFALVQAIRWLTCEDAFAANCVSSHWNGVLSGEGDDNGFCWKQVCQNSFPIVAVHFTENDEIDHRRLTLGLWSGTERSDTASYVYSPRPPPLVADQVFAVVELYRNQPVQGSKRKEKESITSWICPMSSEGFIAMQFTDEDCVKVRGPNPYSLAERDSERVQAWQKERDYLQAMPHVFSVQIFLQNYFKSPSNHSALRVDLTLFRKDTMNSVRILENESFNNDDAYCDFRFTGTEVQYNLTGEELATFGSNKAGNAARRMMYNSGASFLWFQSWFTLSSKLPSRGSNEEPDWLKNSRQAYDESRPYRPSESDRAELSSMPRFEFEVKELFIDLKKQVGREENAFTVDDHDELMVFLEGLRWT